MRRLDRARPRCCACSQGRREFAAALLDRRELSIEERAVGRRRNRASRTPCALRRCWPASAALRAVAIVLLRALESQHVDAAAQARERRVGRQRGFERFQRRIASGRAPGGRHPCPPAPARTSALAASARSKCVTARLRVTARERRVPERRFGRIELRATDFKTALNLRSAACVSPRLQTVPAGSVLRGDRRAPRAPSGSVGKTKSGNCGVATAGAGGSALGAQAPRPSTKAQSAAVGHPDRGDSADVHDARAAGRSRSSSRRGTSASMVT